MTYEAIIFDRDGVLSNFDFESAQQYFAKILPISVFELSNEWITWGNRHGYPSTMKEEISFFNAFWDHIAKQHQLNQTDTLTLKQTDYTNFILPYPETASVVSQVANQGFKIGCLSDFSLVSLDLSLEAMGILKHIDASCSAASMQISKPFPAAYLTICQELNVQPEKCLYFDDEWENVLGARRVGMTSFWINRGGASDQQDPSNAPAFNNLIDAISQIHPHPPII